MKKILLLLALSLFLVSCGNDDDKEEKGYLTSIESVKQGIVGVWKPYNAIYYYGYYSGGKRCNGHSPEELTVGCSKYEIIKDGNKYIMRGYSSGDLDGSSGSYLEAEITLLNENSLTIGSVSYTRVGTL